MEFNWEGFSKKEFAVHCKTRQEANNFLEKCEAKNFMWQCSEKPTKLNYSSDNSNIVYYGENNILTYGESNDSKIKIMEWSDLKNE